MNAIGCPFGESLTGSASPKERHARISKLLQIYGVDPLTVAAADEDESRDDREGLSAIHSIGNGKETRGAESVGAFSGASFANANARLRLDDSIRAL